MLKINDKVKVIGQNIIGKIIEDYGNLVVIIDSDSEFIDDKLEFKKSELELHIVKKKMGINFTIKYTFWFKVIPFVIIRLNK